MTQRRRRRRRQGCSSIQHQHIKLSLLHRNHIHLTQPSLFRDFSGCIPRGVHGFGSIWRQTQRQEAWHGGTFKWSSAPEPWRPIGPALLANATLSDVHSFMRARGRDRFNAMRRTQRVSSQLFHKKYPRLRIWLQTGESCQVDKYQSGRNPHMQKY